MTIVDSILSFLPAKKKNTPSGWIKFNAVCCHNNGQSRDTRSRAGVIVNGEGLSYHCFNCGFKTGYQPGGHLSRKMRQLMSWLNMPDDLISGIAMEALRNKEDSEIRARYSLPEFQEKDLPQGVIPVSQGPEEVLEYLRLRGFNDPDRQGLLWSPEYPDRFLIPFIYTNKIMGWTARKVTEGRPKYISDQNPGFVFNLDSQQDQRTHVLVVEGPMDALSIDGVALLGAEISDGQALLINRLGRQVTLVPDRDSSGAKTALQALDHGWAVSFPDWPEGCKDCNDAVTTMGILATVALIFKHRETNPVKARIKIKSWFPESQTPQEPLTRNN